MAELLLLFTAAFVGTAVLTALIRRYALASNLIDRPNARSSHQTPTPRGGGVAFVVVTLALLPLLQSHGALPAAALVGLLGGGALAAGIGWMDDRWGLPARWRLVVHGVAAAWLLHWLGGPPSIPFPGWSSGTGWLAAALALLALVWLLNLYNFMDGIDGLAALEAITVSLGGALLFYVAGYGAAGALTLVLAAATAGFLGWNFPRARIFMGDAGSGFLGITLGGVALHAALLEPALFWGWVILLGGFIVDSTITLFRRVLRGEAVHQAHRSHAYQHAARQCGSHVPVSSAFAVINIAWLLPWAVLATLGVLPGVAAAAAAYAPLVWLALRWRAGAPEDARHAQTPGGLHPTEAR